MTDLSQLFSPIRIGRMDVANRIMMPGMSGFEVCRNVQTWAH